VAVEDELLDEVESVLAAFAPAIDMKLPTTRPAVRSPAAPAIFLFMVIVLTANDLFAK
jgi:hypothetical protein